jgi:hypothetical protein
VTRLATRLRRAEAHLGTSPADVTDRSTWDWYAESCLCGLLPGECRAHPRARLGQRPPTGDWRAWPYIAGRGAARRGPARAGFSTASTTAL